MKLDAPAFPGPLMIFSHDLNLFLHCVDATIPSHSKPFLHYSTKSHESETLHPSPRTCCCTRCAWLRLWTMCFCATFLRSMTSLYFYVSVTPSWIRAHRPQMATYLILVQGRRNCKADKHGRRGSVHIDWGPRWIVTHGTPMTANLTYRSSTRIQATLYRPHS